MSSERAWSQSSDTFRPVSTVSISEKLAPAIYMPGVDMGGFFVTQYHDNYVFPYKIYGLNTGFISRIIKTYDNTTGNLGILMNGVKGTGKSVTAEQICNEFIETHNMPVILINNRMQGLIEFLASIDQDIVVFVDEYEKVFVTDEGRSNSSEILTIMDGALKSEHRRLFLFTTNNKRIDENLLERPGRIRYVKEFSDLDKETIEEVVDDLLIHKTRRKACIDFISKLNKITIDIIKAIITEVNIHDEDPSDFAKIFNAATQDKKYNIYAGRLTAKDKASVMPIVWGCHAFSPDITRMTREQLTMLKGRNVYAQGYSDKVDGAFVSFKDNVLTLLEHDYDEDGKEITVQQEFTIESVTPVHSSYADNYAF